MIMVVNSGSQDLIVPCVYTDVLASVCVCALFPVLARVVDVVMPSDISPSPIATP